MKMDKDSSSLLSRERSQSDFLNEDGGGKVKREVSLTSFDWGAMGKRGLHLISSI